MFYENATYFTKKLKVVLDTNRIKNLIEHSLINILTEICNFFLWWERLVLTPTNTRLSVPTYLC